MNLSHLKVFGAVAYLHIDEVNRDKLDANVKHCIFIGYGGDELRFRIWNDTEKKVVRGLNVVFNEKIPYKDLLLRKPIEGFEEEVAEPEALDIEED